MGLLAGGEGAQFPAFMGNASELAVWQSRERPWLWRLGEKSVEVVGLGAQAPRKGQACI